MVRRHMNNDAKGAANPPPLLGVAVGSCDGEPVGWGCDEGWAVGWDEEAARRKTKLRLEYNRAAKAGGP